MPRTVLGALLALLLFPAAAHAAPDTVIDFNNQATNTRVTDQYDGVGVNFGSPESLGVPAPTRPTCGAPYAEPGIAGQSADVACRTGSNEFPDRYFGTAFEFSTERRAVSFDLQERILDSLQVGVRFYAIGGTLLNQQVLTLGRNATVHVSYANATTSGGIADVVIYDPTTGQQSYSDAGALLLDNIDATLDDVPPPKKFSLALATPSIEVVEGSTAPATLSVRRFNGSNGNVTINVGALPSGIVGTQVTPNPTAGKNPLTLTVSAASTFTGTRQLQVSATGDSNAGQAIGAALTQSVTGIPAVTIPTGGRFPIRLVPGCGKQPYTDDANVRGDYTGYVGVGGYNETGGLDATAVDGSFHANGNGSYPVKLTLDPGTNPSGSGTFDFTTTPSGATEQKLTESWLADPLAATAITGSVPRPIVAGEQHVAVTGNFPTSCAITFQDQAGQDWPVTRRDITNPDDGSKVQDIAILDPPTTAVPGPLKVIGANGAVLATTKPVDVRDFRNVFALGQANAGDGAKGTFNWEDFERTFGDDDAESCFIVCVRDPVAEHYYRDFQSDVKSGGGLCAGYMILALRFLGFQGASERPANYQPGETRAWRIAPVTDGTDIKRDVVRWFVAQNDKGFIQARKDALARSAADERTYLKDLVNQAGGAYLSIRQGTGGHALVAYAVRDDGAGGLTVSVADPNIPYSAAEETNATTRTTQLTKATIKIASDGSWSGSSLGWKGPNNTLGVIGYIPSTDATLPADFSLSSLFDGSAAGGAPPAAVAQITEDGKATLDGDGVPTGSGDVTLIPQESGVSAEPQYALAKGKSYDLTVQGGTAGQYVQGLLGDGTGATVEGAKTAPGQSDHVELRPGQASLAFSTGAASAPVTYSLIGEHGKGKRTATVDVTAKKGGKDETELSGSVLRLEHQGAATTARVTLGTVGEGLPGSVVTAPMKLGANETIELKPTSWRALDAGVQLTVKDARGHVLRRGAVRLAAAKGVKLAGVKAKRKGAKVLVTGRVVKPGEAPVLTVMIGKKAVTLRGPQVRKGRFSLTVKGTGKRVTVQLLDEAADLATTRQEVAVKG